MRSTTEEECSGWIGEYFEDEGVVDMGYAVPYPDRAALISVGALWFCSGSVFEKFLARYLFLMPHSGALAFAHKHCLFVLQ